MADQDFNIKVVTTADTTGIRQTSVELDKLKQQQATFAETARRQAAAAAAAAAQAKPVSTISDTAGVTGTAVGLGTIVTLLTASLSKWREFNAEQDRWVDGMIKSQEKSRELGLAVADMLDAMKSAERIETEPLQVSFDRLKQKAAELKTEMQLAFGSGEYEDVKRYAAALGVVESQIHRVTSAIDREAEASRRSAEEAEKAAEKRARSEESFIKGAVETTGPQVQAALRNEEAARRAAAAGDERSAEQFRKTSEQIQRGMTGGQSEEFNQLKTEMVRMNVSLQMILETFR